MMKYILIANNKSITDADIDRLIIEEDDVIILFNHQYPIKWDKIKNHPHKILIIRLLNWGFLGYNQTHKYYDKYSTIIPYSKFIYTDELIKKFFIKKFGPVISKKAVTINSEIQEILKNVVKYPQNKDPTLGLIGYLYIKYMINVNSRIHLVGFTLIYNGKLGNGPGHAWKFELDYYKKEMIDNELFTKDDLINAPLEETIQKKVPIQKKQTKSKSYLETERNKKRLLIKPLEKKNMNLFIKPEKKNLLKLHISRNKFMKKR